VGDSTTWQQAQANVNSLRFVVEGDSCDGRADLGGTWVRLGYLY